MQAGQLEAAIRLGMATDPARRPATPGELVERLRSGWEAGLPTGVVTLCCSDIEAAAAAWDTDPGAMAQALVRHDELIADAVEANGGRLVKTLGDDGATVSVFDSATRAVEAVMAAQRALAAEPWPADLRLAVRWGIHTGEVERRDAGYVGPAMRSAAQVRAQAEGGQILLSRVTSELVAGHLSGGCSLVDLGPHRLTATARPSTSSRSPGPGIEAPPPATTCPYRGLLAFQPGDERFFFGRELVVDDILGRLAPGRLAGRRRRLREREVLAPARRRRSPPSRRRGARGRGRRAGHARRRPGARRRRRRRAAARRRPVRGAVHAVRRRRRGARVFVDALLAPARSRRGRAARRPLRATRRASATSRARWRATRCCSAR